MVNFDRVKYYVDYYRNLSPSAFGVERDGDDIIITNIKGIESRNINEMKLPKLSMVQPIVVSNDDKTKLKNISIDAISFEPLNSDSPVNFKVSIDGFSGITNGIAFDIQLTKNDLLQPHIALHKDLKGLGLGYKLYKRFIDDFGHLYSSSSRRQNNKEIPKIWAKLKTEPDVECVSNDLGDLCISKTYVSDEEKRKLLSNIGVVIETHERIRLILRESLNRFDSH
jgi:hypothetical protein